MSKMWRCLVHAMLLLISSAVFPALLAGSPVEMAAVVPAGLQLPSTLQHTLQHENGQPRQLLQQGKKLVVAHRGASGPLPEHTIAAYWRAIEQGADFIECDVVVTKDMQLICRHEPNLNDTTDAWTHYRDRATSYVIDGQQVDGIFACDLTLAEVQQLKAKQRWAFRDHSFDGQYGVVTFDIFMDLALAANRPVGIYPEAKHPTWHNQLPAMQAGRSSIEELMVKALHSKGYATSAPYGSLAWRSKPVFIQSFEVKSLRRFAALTPVPLALLLDSGNAPDTGAPLSDIISEESLSQLSSFITVVAPWKALFYTLVDKGSLSSAEAAAAQHWAPFTASPNGTGGGTESSRRLLSVEMSGSEQGMAGISTVAGFSHPDVPLDSTAEMLQATQQLQSTGLAARLHKHGFLVHTYTLRDEQQFVLPTCKGDYACELEWLFHHEQLDGAFADWPGTLHHWLQQQRT